MPRQVEPVEPVEPRSAPLGGRRRARFSRHGPMYEERTNARRSSGAQHRTVRLCQVLKIPFIALEPRSSSYVTRRKESRAACCAAARLATSSHFRIFASVVARRRRTWGSTVHVDVVLAWSTSMHLLRSLTKASDSPIFHPFCAAELWLLHARCASCDDASARWRRKGP